MPVFKNNGEQPLGKLCSLVEGLSRTSRGTSHFSQEHCTPQQFAFAAMRRLLFRGMSHLFLLLLLLAGQAPGQLAQSGVDIPDLLAFNGYEFRRDLSHHIPWNCSEGTFEVQESGGHALPSWLKISPDQCMLSGVPLQTSDEGPLYLNITAYSASKLEFVTGVTMLEVQEKNFLPSEIADCFTIVSTFHISFTSSLSTGESYAAQRSALLYGIATLYKQPVEHFRLLQLSKADNKPANVNVFSLELSCSSPISSNKSALDMIAFEIKSIMETKPVVMVINILDCPFSNTSQGEFVIQSHISSIVAKKLKQSTPTPTPSPTETFLLDEVFKTPNDVSKDEYERRRRAVPSRSLFSITATPTLLPSPTMSLPHSSSTMIAIQTTTLLQSSPAFSSQPPASTSSAVSHQPSSVINSAEFSAQNAPSSSVQVGFLSQTTISQPNPTPIPTLPFDLVLVMSTSGKTGATNFATFKSLSQHIIQSLSFASNLL